MTTLPPRPRDEDIERAARLFDPLRHLAQPYFDGWDRIPDDRPLLFVGNHTLYGVLDVPFMYMALFRKKGIVLRPLGDHIHFAIPIWRDLLARYGVVDGTRENCSALMDANECLLVFPGGAREVAKRRGEKYQLIWKQRLGFVRLAVRHGCTIVPFSAVGVEDAYDIVIDADDVMQSPLGAVLRKLEVRLDVLMPLARGVGPTPVPRPERFYFRFGAAIPTREHAGAQDDDEICHRLRDRVSAAIEAGIEELIAYRAADPLRPLRARLELLAAKTGYLDLDPGSDRR